MAGQRAAMTSLPKALLLLAVAVVLHGPAAAQEDPIVVSGVPSVIADGDTMTLAGERIRMFGVDAPELKQSCLDASGASYPCGQVSRDALADVIGDSTVECEQRDQDQYGRIVAVCYSPLPDGGWLDLNGWMVEQGLAVAYTRYTDDYVGAEQAARQARRGLWAGEFQMPEDFRRNGGGDSGSGGQVPSSQQGSQQGSTTGSITSGSTTTGSTVTDSTADTADATAETMTTDADEGNPWDALEVEGGEAAASDPVWAPGPAPGPAPAPAPAAEVVGGVVPGTVGINAGGDTSGTADTVGTDSTAGSTTGSSSSQSGCLIKGNISASSGAKIYHMPGSSAYDTTVIEESKGERWFCSEEEAVAAGWRPAA